MQQVSRASVPLGGTLFFSFPSLFRYLRARIMHTGERDTRAYNAHESDPVGGIPRAEPNGSAHVTFHPARIHPENAFTFSRDLLPLYTAVHRFRRIHACARARQRSIYFIKYVTWRIFAGLSPPPHTAIVVRSSTCTPSFSPRPHFPVIPAVLKVDPSVTADPR